MSQNKPFMNILLNIENILKMSIFIRPEWTFKCSIVMWQEIFIFSSSIFTLPSSLKNFLFIFFSQQFLDVIRKVWTCCICHVWFVKCDFFQQTLENHEKCAIDSDWCYFWNLSDDVFDDFNVWRVQQKSAVFKNLATKSTSAVFK